MEFKPLLKHRDTTIFETRSGSLFIEESEAASVAVVVIRGNDVILVEQYRHQLEKNTFELPGGGLDPGEEPELGAKRELEEETGIIAEQFVYLGTYHPQPYFTNRFSYLFFTADTTNIGQQNLDEDEQITVRRIPINEVLDSITHGQYTDGELGYGIFLCMVKGLIP